MPMASSRTARVTGTITKIFDTIDVDLIGDSDVYDDPLICLHVIVTL
jgi:hypothetical protein